MIVDHTAIPLPGHMLAQPCADQACTAEWERLWGIRILTHHHPAGVPTAEDGYLGERHLLFDDDHDLVTRWRWWETAESFKVHYIPQWGGPEAHRRRRAFEERGEPWPSPLDLMHGAEIDDSRSINSHSASLSMYHSFVLATRWELLHVDVTEEDIAAAKASILREMNA